MLVKAEEKDERNPGTNNEPLRNQLQDSPTLEILIMRAEFPHDFNHFELHLLLLALIKSSNHSELLLE